MSARLLRYWNAPLCHFFTVTANRFLVYALLTLSTGILTFVALKVYGLLAPYNATSLSFQAIYAWETALNFGLCLFIVDTGWGRLTTRWGAFEQRTVGMTWVIWFCAYILAFIVERTLVYWSIAVYNPEITKSFRDFPELRPLFWESFFYCLPFWLAMVSALIQTALRLETGADSTLEHLSSARADGSSSGVSLRLAIGKSVEYLRCDTISHIRIEDHYARIYIQIGDDTQEILRKISLKHLLSMLPNDQFVQIHRSHAVNIAYVKRVRKSGRAHKVVLKNVRTALPVSRHRLAALRPILTSIIV